MYHPSTYPKQTTRLWPWLIATTCWCLPLQATDVVPLSLDPTLDAEQLATLASYCRGQAHLDQAHKRIEVPLFFFHQAENKLKLARDPSHAMPVRQWKALANEALRLAGERVRVTDIWDPLHRKPLGASEPHQGNLLHTHYLSIAPYTLTYTAWGLLSLSILCLGGILIGYFLTQVEDTKLPKTKHGFRDTTA